MEIWAIIWPSAMKIHIRALTNSKILIELYHYIYNNNNNIDRYIFMVLSSIGSGEKYSKKLCAAKTCSGAPTKKKKEITQ